jgi:thioesterase domain-containing protein
MAGHYLAAVRRARPEGPYALLGHSFGGIVAFEMARRLLEEGQPVALLAMADAWRVPADRPPAAEDRATILGGLAHDFGIPLDRLDMAWDHFWSLAPDEQVTYALDLAISGRVLPQEISLARVRRALKLHVTNIEAMRRYLATPLGCPIVLLRASEELSLAPRDPDLGWGELTRSGVEVLTVPGNHFTMLREPHVQIVAERLRRCLDVAMPAGPPNAKGE